MSLGVLIKAPEGIVLAAESRVTLTAVGPNNQTIFTNFDNASKLLTFENTYNKIGVVTYGQAGIGFRSAQSFIPEFEAHLQQNNRLDLNIVDFAQELSNFLLQQWQLVMPAAYVGPNMIIYVAGFDNNEPYGKVVTFQIPALPVPTEVNPPQGGQYQFGISWGGQREIVDRIIMGYDHRIFDLLAQAQLDQPAIDRIRLLIRQLNLSIPIQFMPLQDCVNLAILFIKTTIEAQNFTVGVRGCGGSIDVAIITRNKPLKFIQQKNIIGHQ